VGCRFPDREIEEPWSSSGREEEDPVRADVPEGAAASGVVSEREYLFAFCSRERKFTMPPRRERQSPDPEDREVRRRGRQVANPEMERQMRDLRARLEDMETAQRRTASAGDLSDSEMKLRLNARRKLQPKMQQMNV
jgi:hypothetical protein